MKMVSLLGIRILCKTGCEVIFDDEKCQVNFKGETILTGYKDPTSDLWTNRQERLWTTPGSDSVASEQTPSRPGPDLGQMANLRTRRQAR
jgi:hypothetical protein